MLRIALLGRPGTGKSTLAYTFSKFLERRGLSVAVANLDGEVKRLPYKAAVDARKDKEPLKAIGKVRAEVALLDTPYCLEEVLYGGAAEGLRGGCAVALLIANAHKVVDWESLDLLGSAAELAGEALEVPVVAVLNKSDLAKPARQRGARALEAHERSHAKGGAMRVSAVTREGFEELWQAVQAAVRQ